MIDRVHFENFKSLKNVTLELGRLTVLVGPNGCGKSSVLKGIELLSQAATPLPGENQNTFLRFAWIFSGPTAPGRLASPGRPTEMAFSMRESGGDDLQLRVIAITPPGLNLDNDPSRFQVLLEGPEGSISITIPSPQGKEKDQQGLVDPRVQRFASAVYLHLDANVMTESSVPKDERSRMGSDGSQLASALAWMKGAAEDELIQVTKGLQKIVPGVKRIRTLRERTKRRRIEQIEVERQPVWRPIDEMVLADRFEIEFDDGSVVPADLLSEGTVLALGLLTKLYEPERPRLVLLDDIDRGLHIEAQSRLVEVLRGVMEIEPELQIVCTTHSPYLLDRFDASEVRVLELDARRHTHALPLTAHPEFSRWKYGVQTGELWAALGSAWVAGPEEQPK